jgi:glycosyltransferase involved in cell wall biosynthesis
MKIACITTSVIPSSSANSIQAMKVVHALKELGQDVRLWLPEFKQAGWPELADLYGLRSPFPVDWLPFRSGLKQYDFSWQAVNLARRWGADLIYTWSLQAARFALLCGKPAVMEFHDFPMGRLGPYLFKGYIHSKNPRLTLCTTRALAEGLEEDYGFHFEEGQLQIAPNGVELERYQNLPAPQAARQQLGLKDGLTIGYSGHFYPGRGMGVLLDLARALPQVNFLLMGGRPEDVAPWQAQFEQDGLHNVTITGFIPNSRLPLYQAAADILLMPYKKAISGSSGGNIARVINPMKMFDYLASGRAIAASNIPVFHEVLNDKNAYFCEPENAQDWIKGVGKLVQDQALRARLGKQAKQDAAQYTWKRRAQTSLDLLQNLLQ